MKLVPYKSHIKGKLEVAKRQLEEVNAEMQMSPSNLMTDSDINHRLDLKGLRVRIIKEIKKLETKLSYYE